MAVFSATVFLAVALPGPSGYSSVLDWLRHRMEIRTEPRFDRVQLNADLVGSLTEPRNGAAKYRQDPRSPRKSAMDLFKAGVISLTPLASLGTTTWDYEDRRRVVIQRNAVTRVRPAMRKGWKADVELMINLPEYIDQSLLLDVLGTAGRLIGVGDFRPTYGRFDVTGFKIL